MLSRFDHDGSQLHRVGRGKSRRINDIAQIPAAVDRTEPCVQWRKPRTDTEYHFSRRDLPPYWVPCMGEYDA